MHTSLPSHEKTPSTEGAASSNRTVTLSAKEHNDE